MMNGHVRHTVKVLCNYYNINVTNMNECGWLVDKNSLRFLMLLIGYYLGS